MPNIKFTDNSLEVKTRINDAISAWLYEVGGEIQARAVRNSRVDTGQLKNSWDYNVDEGNQTVTIGSPLENAIWEEFGTGEYAMSGGRQGGWVYVDAKGEGHFTRGKTPNRTLHKAFDPMKGKIKNMLEEKIKEELG